MTESSYNIDQRELNKFDDLASRWWDTHSEFKPLHDINPLRLEYIAQRVPLSGKQVLDVGCGGGILAEAMAAEGAHVTGIDMAKAALSVAELHLLESGLDVEYRQTTAECLADEQSSRFDVVTCMELLEHVPDPASTVNACAHLVKPGGHLFFSTINRNPKSFLFAIVGAEYLLRLLPKGTHEFAKFIRPAELARWIRVADLSLEELTGMSYNPITQHYRLGHDIDVNYLAYCRRHQ